MDEHGHALDAPQLSPRAITDQPGGGFVHALAEWQGLEAGALAIVAALIGARVLNRQTRQNRSLEEDRRKRRLRALRAVLPLTLSSLAEWADACGSALLDATDRSKGVGLVRSALPSVPAIPAEILPQLEAFVEASDEAGAESVANLLADIQIFSSRMRGAGFLPGSRPPRNQVVSDLESHLLGIGAIAAHIAALFDFSRRRSDATPSHPTWLEVRTALKLIGADPDSHPKLFARLGGRERSGRTPGYLGVAEPAEVKAS